MVCLVESTVNTGNVGTFDKISQIEGGNFEAQ